MSKSSIKFLYSFDLQVTDAYVIMNIMLISFAICDICLSMESKSLFVCIFVDSSILADLLALFLYDKYILISLRSLELSYFYICAFLEYFLIIMGVTPLILYFYIEQHWTLLNEYGTECLIYFKHYTNWILPVAIFLFVSVTYWIVTYLLQKEGLMYKKLEKRKKELYG